MRFWQKSFLILLTVSMLAANIAIYSVVHITYQEELQNVKNKAKGEAFFIATAISNDWSTLDSNMGLTYEKMEQNFTTYLTYYQKTGIMLEMWKGNNLQYGNIPSIASDRKELQVDDTNQIVLIRSIDHEKYIFVSTKLADDYNNYTLVYAYSMQQLEKSVSHQQTIIIGIDIVIVVLLAIILYMILKKLTLPLRQLSKATEHLSNGQYGKVIEIKGKDEFAELAGRFNEMSIKIKSNMEMLKEENNKKQVLIDNMAHELRTPLTSIYGYAEYMKLANLNEEERYESLEYIMSETKRLEKLSKLLLTMADLREDGLVMERIDVKQFLAHIEKLVKQKMLEKNLQFSIKSEIINMDGNEPMLESLLVNLLENAIRACSEGDQIILTAQQKERLYLTVEDTGIGMKQEELTHITEAFYRVDKARSRKYGGVGLGVSLCQAIVLAHHGTMQYESEPGAGTKVTVIL